jgi:hypothetical protein
MPYGPITLKQHAMITSLAGRVGVNVAKCRAYWMPR